MTALAEANPTPRSRTSCAGVSARILASSSCQARWPSTRRSTPNSSPPEFAADVVWFDAYVTNVDRTSRNTNLLVCGERVWLIDHGAALYFHHRWSGWRERIQSPFAQIADHVLLHAAGDLAAADARLRPRLDKSMLTAIVESVPEEWLDAEEEEFIDLDDQRQAYLTYLVERLNGPRAWLTEAASAQQRGPQTLQRRLTHRVV